MKILSILPALFFVTTLLAQEGGTTAFSLEQAMTHGIENNLTVKNAQLEYEEAKKRVGEATAIGFPQINANGNVTHNIDIPTQVIPAQAFNPAAPPDQYEAVQFGITNSATYSVSAKQMIFDGTFFVGLQAAKSYKELREHGIAKTEIEIRVRITHSYFNVLIAERNAEIFNENIAKLQTQFNEIQKMNEQGLLEELEVDQLDYILSDAKKRSETTKRQVQIAYQMLNLSMGRELEDPITLTDSLEKIYQSYNEADLLGKDLSIENHIDYQLISTREHIQELMIKADKATRLPSINAQYFYGRNAFADDFGFNKWYPNSFIALNVSMPIFTSLQNTRKLQQSKIQLNRIQNDRMMLEDNLQLQVNTARTNYIDALEQYKTEQKNLNLARKIFNTTTIKQSSGMASSLDVTVANNQYLESQGRYIGALYRILEAKASLDKSLNNY